MSFRQTIGDVLKPAVDLIYPPRCPSCGDAIADQKGVCSRCWSELVIPAEPSCSTCQRPMGSDTAKEEMQCLVCMADPPKHDGIAAATLYNDAARKLILTFKHGRRIALAEMLGVQMAARLPKLEGDWLIVPVPLHRTRLWYRGFNQSALLAREIAKLTKQRLMVDGLMRTKRTDTLGGLGRKARERTLSGAISVSSKRAAEMEGRDIVLVDDVLTSGATSDACVRALKKAGSNKVLISCYSRVIDEAATL